MIDGEVAIGRRDNQAVVSAAASSVAALPPKPRTAGVDEDRRTAAMRASRARSRPVGREQRVEQAQPEEISAALAGRESEATSLKSLIEIGGGLCVGLGKAVLPAAGGQHFGAEKIIGFGRCFMANSEAVIAGGQGGDATLPWRFRHGLR